MVVAAVTLSGCNENDDHSKDNVDDETHLTQTSSEISRFTTNFAIDTRQRVTQALMTTKGDKLVCRGLVANPTIQELVDLNHPAINIYEFLCHDPVDQKTEGSDPIGDNVMYVTAIRADKTIRISVKRSLEAHINVRDTAMNAN